MEFDQLVRTLLFVLAGAHAVGQNEEAPKEGVNYMSEELYESAVVSRINRKFRRLNLGSLQVRCKREKYYLQHVPTEYVLSHGLDLEQLARQMAVLQPGEWE